VPHHLLDGNDIEVVADHLGDNVEAFLGMVG